MSSAVFHVLFSLVAAAPAGADANPLLMELVDKGIAMPDGTIAPLAAPSMADGSSTADQAKAIAKVATARPTTYELFTQKSSTAPITIKVRTLKGQDEAVFRAVDLWFVAHGDWDTLVSKEFTDGITKANPGQAKNEGGTLSKAGFLTDAEMQKRDLPSRTKQGHEERYFYTTFTLFDRVEVSVTRDAVLSRTPKSIVLACKVDPRFAKDAEFPNQWRSLERDAAANLVFGPKKLYSGAGFYVKVTRLTQPVGAIFVEYHSIFNEPKGWFDGESLLRAKLPTIAEHQVKQFRGKFAKASADRVGAKTDGNP
jgi:hypothetical protein